MRQFELRIQPQVNQGSQSFKMARRIVGFILCGDTGFPEDATTLCDLLGDANNLLSGVHAEAGRLQDALARPIDILASILQLPDTNLKLFLAWELGGLVEFVIEPVEGKVVSTRSRFA